jgi:hypothetical protein
MRCEQAKALLHCCRHLIEQRLKEVVIPSINHNDTGVCMLKGP